MAHDWKALAASEDPSVAPPLEHDTMVAAYLIDPARRGYPLDELADGARPRRARSRTATTWPRRAVLTRALAERQRARARGAGPDAAAGGGRAAAGGRAGGDGARGREARRAAACARSPPGSASEAAALEREIWELAGRGVHDRLAPAAGPDPVREARACRKKRRGKTGFSTDARVLQAIRHEHEIVPKIEEWRELTKLKTHLPRRVPRAGGRRRPAAHHLQPGHRRHRPAVVAPTPTSRTSPSAPSAGARSAPASWPRRATG